MKRPNPEKLLAIAESMPGEPSAMILSSAQAAVEDREAIVRVPPPASGSRLRWDSYPDDHQNTLLEAVGGTTNGEDGDLYYRIKQGVRIAAVYSSQHPRDTASPMGKFVDSPRDPRVEA